MPVRVATVRPRYLTDEQIATWLDFQRSSSAFGDPFLSPGFAIAVDEFRRDVHVATIADASGMLGFLAFQRGRWPLAYPVGSGISDAQAIVHRPDWRVDGPVVLAGAGLARYAFDNLVSRQNGLANARKIVRSNWVVDLSVGWDGYLTGRRAARTSVIDDTRRDMGRLERDHGPVAFAAHNASQDAFALLKRWKSEQYLSTGAWDRFEEAWIVGVLERLVLDDLQGCSGQLSTLSVGDRVVAVHLGLRSEDRLVSWFPAYDPAYSRYGVGRQLLLRLLQHSCEQGLAGVWLGQGAEAYKQRFANRTEDVVEGRLARPSLVRGHKTAKRAAEALRVDDLARQGARWMRDRGPR